MTRASIYIERLIVTKSNQTVYDERFHRGINVIRGDHSVGKTTILELIFYVLGGEIKSNQWLYPADKCDVIFCQLNINNNVFTISRQIEKGQIPPILIKFGDYDAHCTASSWMSFGPRRNEASERMSFSQKIFELLGWNTYKTEDYANLTMHQLLRFLYVDQETTSTRIFRNEDNPRADSENSRLAIAEFLLGLDNLDTHQLRQELIISEREFENVSSDLNAMYKILGDDSSTTMSSLLSDISSNVTEIKSLSDYQPEVVTNKNSDYNSIEIEILKLQKDINTYNKQLQQFERDIVFAEGEIIDCELFGKSLEYRKKALLESKSAYDAIGLVKYEHCPCCLGPIESQHIDENHDDVCHLCKAPIGNEKHNSNYLEILNELNFQITGNKKVLSDYIEHKSGLQASIEIVKGNLVISRGKLSELSKSVDPTSFEKLERARKIGFLEAENKSLQEKVRVISGLDQQKQKKIFLNTKITELKEKIKAASVSNAKRREKVYLGISQQMVNILHSDKRTNGKPYEEDFASARASDIEIDFAKDRVLINERIKFSGSSNYIKKNSLNLSALIESLSDDNYRLPRFMMIDAIENGGMKESRSHNFQQTIFDKLKGRDDFQLIFCTSMVLSDFNNEHYGVGKYYSDNVLKI